LWEEAKRELRGDPPCPWRGAHSRFSRGGPQAQRRCDGGSASDRRGIESWRRLRRVYLESPTAADIAVVQVPRSAPLHRLRGEKGGRGSAIPPWPGSRKE